MNAEEIFQNFLTQASDWKSAGVFGTIVGGLMGGAADANAKVRQVIGDFPRLEFRDIFEIRFQFSRSQRGSIYGGLLLSMYIGAHNLVAEKRGVVDLSNCVGTGAATTSVLAMMATPLGASVTRRAALGTILGAACFVPIGWLHLKMLEEQKRNAIRGKATMNDV